MKRTFTLFALIVALLSIVGCAAPQQEPTADATCVSCSVIASVEETHESGVVGSYEVSRDETIVNYDDGSTLIDSSSHRSLITPTPTTEVVRVNPAHGEETIPVEEDANTIRVNPGPNGLNAVNSPDAGIDPQYSQEAVQNLQNVFLLGEGFEVLLQSGPQKNFTISNSVGEIRCGKMSTAYANCENQDLGYNALLFLRSAEIQYGEEVSLQINGLSVTGATFKVEPGDVVTEFSGTFRIMQR